MTDELVADRVSSTPTAERTKRPDIQALRAFAVMAVVLNHLWDGFLPGGFIGVDVFFVISGFLITDHLMRAISSGRPRLGNFWLRRALRLLPASLLVAAVSLVGVLVLVPRSEWNIALPQIGASAVYLQNWQLIAQATDYFTSAGSPSPVTHYWSLSVEEQFYLVWPLLMLAPWALGRATDPAVRRRRVIAVLGVVVAASWLFGVWRSADHPEAYFSTFARAWEFGIGGLLALSASALATRIGPQVRSIALGAWLVLFGSAVLITPEQPFPGWVATIPVLATVAVIASGTPRADGRAIAGPLASHPAVQFLGDISYSLYLWHWPLIILAPLLLDSRAGNLDRTAMLLVSLVLAAATKQWVEDPVRRLSSAPPRTRYAAAGVLTLTTIAIVAACLLGRASVDAARADAQAELEQLSATPCFGAGATAPGADCRDVHVLAIGGAELMTAESQGNPVEGGSSCQQEPDESAVLTCGFGAPADTADLTVLLTGDSHAGHWVQALDELAARNNWRIEMYVRSSCPTTVGDGIGPDWAVETTESCGEWRKAAVRAIAQRRDVDVVVTSAISREYSRYKDGVQTSRDVAGAFGTAWSTWLEAGKAVVAIDDLPQMGLGLIPPCIEREGSTDPCTAPQAQALAIPDPIKAAAKTMKGEPGFASFDPIPFVCDDRVCHSVSGGIPVYADASHLTNAYSRSFAPYLGDAISDALRQLG